MAWDDEDELPPEEQDLQPKQMEALIRKLREVYRAKFTSNTEHREAQKREAESTHEKLNALEIYILSEAADHLYDYVELRKNDIPVIANTAIQNIIQKFRSAHPDMLDELIKISPAVANNDLVAVVD